MNKQMKRRIQKAFEAPRPNEREKARFLRTLPQPQISMWQFVLTQAAYLRKRTLFLGVVFLLPTWIVACCIEKNTLWIVSSFIPFLGILAVSENVRSFVYGMDEFEMSARFSLKSVMLARMGILGVLDMLILCSLAPLCRMENQVTLFQTGIYLFVPYLLTVNISLWITRRFHNKEAIYACMSVAVLVSGANMWLHLMTDFVYQFSYIKWWFVLSVFLLGGILYETYYTIKQTEELVWNS